MSLTPGTVIAGRYILVEEVGKGGFGQVWRAQVEGTGQSVAVKFLTDVDAETARRFDTEVDVLVRLEHPSILRPIEHGKTGFGTPYLITEFVEGETLFQWMQRLPTPEEVHAMVLGLAEALKAAHRAGVVHRDLKPENVMVRRDGRPCVLDFGIAKLVGRQTPDVTKTGAVLGTPGYMSPEQLRGMRDVGAATDLYSLGVLSYEALEGRPVHAGSGPLEIVMKHLNESPPPMRTTGPLADLVLELLDKDPARRPTATAVVSRLTGSTRGLAEPEKSLGYAAIGALTAVILLAGVLVWQLWPDAPEPVRVATRSNPLAAPAAEPLPDAGPATVADVAAADLGPVACPRLADLPAGSQPAPELGVGAWIHLPEGYTPRKRYPLIMLFHDAHQEPDVALQNIDFDDPRAQEFVFIAPLGDPDHLGRQQWRGQVVTHAQDSLRSAQDFLCVDLDQLFVIGHGRGGDAASQFRCGESPVAVASFAFRRSPSTRCDVGTPELMIFAMDDPVSPPDRTRGCSSTASIPMSKQVARGRERNSCMGTTQKLASGCWRHTCEMPLSHCEVPGTRRWRSQYNEMYHGSVLLGRCPVLPPTEFPVTQTIFDFFDEVRAKRNP